jgi:hypothetical protein
LTKTHFICRPPATPRWCAINTRIHKKNRCQCPPLSRRVHLSRSFFSCRRHKAPRVCPVGKKVYRKSRCICPPRTRRVTLDRTYMICKRAPIGRYCAVNVKIHFSNKCTCPPHTTRIRLDRSHTKCVRRKKPACPPYQKRCPTGPRKGTCYYVSCPPFMRLVRTRTPCDTRCVSVYRKKKP